MKRGDIYLASLDPTKGREQQGTRPVLIVSPAPFNIFTGCPVVLPITTGGRFARNAGFTVSLDGAGTRTTGVIRCDQPRVMDLNARNAHKLESVSQDIVDEVLAKLAPLFMSESQTDRRVIPAIGDGDAQGTRQGGIPSAGNCVL